jgi:hypothetical protein
MISIKITRPAQALFTFVLLLALVLSASALLAQGTLDVVRTGDAGSLTILRSGLIADSQSPFLRFQFGFATEEQIVPDVFLDSITASLQVVGDPSATLVLFTVDRSGANWAPFSPGAIPLHPNSIQRQVTAFPSLQPQLDQREAYEVTVAIPPVLQDRPMNFYFDLFDNQNSLRSLAWLGDVTAVPEPGWAALSLCGLVCWWFVRGRRR